jgi:hypothetical protein
MIEYNKYDDEIARNDSREFHATREDEVNARAPLSRSERKALLAQDLRRNLPEDAGYVRRIHEDAARRARARKPCVLVYTAPRRPILGRRVQRARRARRIRATSPAASAGDGPPPASPRARTLAETAVSQ